MKKIGLTFILVVIVSALSGCSASTPSGDELLMAAAHKCSDNMLRASKNTTGKTTFKTIFRDKATIVRVGVGTQETHDLLSIPYVESSALDNGNPGSAWRTCMQAKGYI